jgi:hypothetical protein
MKFLFLSILVVMPILCIAQIDLDPVENTDEESQELQTERLLSSLKTDFNYRDTSVNNWSIFPFLDVFELSAIQAHFRGNGPMFTKYELIAIDGLRTESIRRLLIEIEESTPQWSAHEIVHAERTSLEFTNSIGIKLPTARGFGTDSNRFLGNAFKSYHRLRIHHGKAIEFSYIGDKDPGEKILENAYVIQLSINGICITETVDE